MAQTITPVVHGGRGARWAKVIALHVVGATASAALLGAALGAAGAALGAPWGLLGAAVVVTVAGAYGLRELVGLPVPIPELRRQVPEWWRSAFSPGTAGALYGVGLGFGFATHLRHGTLVAVAAASVASGDPAMAAVVVGTFGVARSAAVAAAWLPAGDRDVDALTEALERLAVRPGARILNGVLLAAVAVFGALAATSSSSANADRIPPVAAVGLAVVFAAAAAAKALRWGNWRRALATYRIPAPLATAIVVPVGEASVPAAILAGAPAAGATLALFLLLAFTAAALRAAPSVGDRLPCGCFGGSRSRSVRFILARNIGLAILAATAAGAGPSPVPSFGPGDALPALLAAIGVALTAALVVRASRLIRRDRAYGQG